MPTSEEVVRKYKEAQRNDLTCSQIIEYFKIWSTEILKSDNGPQFISKVM